MRERGLKPDAGYVIDELTGVAPHAGAWIETGVLIVLKLSNGSRSPCGSVD